MFYQNNKIIFNYLELNGLLQLSAYYETKIPELALILENNLKKPIQ